MKNSVRLEFRKMHRLHSVFVVISLVVAVAALSSASLFSSGTRETFNDPAAAPWAALLLSYTMMAAMTSPILTAVLASRQTDIEHPALGWILAATAGRTAGGMCRAKLVALTALLFPATVVQSLLVIGLGNFAGIGVPFDALPWAIYTLSLFALNVAFCALHIWLAARVENQLISMGVGILGAFLAVFSLLMPEAVSRVIPWGYYAVISQVGQSDQGVAFIDPPYLWIAMFLFLVALAFASGTRQLNRMGR